MPDKRLSMKDEFYFSLHAPEANSVEEAVGSLRGLLAEELAARGLTAENICFIRVFCSDICNQIPALEKLWPRTDAIQRIYIGQQPLDSAYLSMQVYCLAGDILKTDKGEALLIRHGGYESLWMLKYPLSIADSEIQTDEIIHAAQITLANHEMTLNDNVVRTWYYLRDVDNTYAGMIKSRVRRYEACGLAAESHYIASTGIEGQNPDPHALVGLHVHAMQGLRPGQIKYLKALENLSPTNKYGVNFERATKIIYGDRSHIHISGTASIDKDGNVQHKGNVRRQTERAIQNIEALLLEGGMSISQMTCATVYLRDAQDYGRVKDLVRALLPGDCAININRGAVCRPEWLVEIEGEAVDRVPSQFANFL